MLVGLGKFARYTPDEGKDLKEIVDDQLEDFKTEWVRIETTNSDAKLSETHHQCHSTMFRFAHDRSPGKCWRSFVHSPLVVCQAFLCKVYEMCRGEGRNVLNANWEKQIDLFGPTKIDPSRWVYPLLWNEVQKIVTG